MIRKNEKGGFHLVINLKVVGALLGLLAIGTLIASVIAARVGFFSYQPEVQSVEPVEDVPGAYIVHTHEEPAEGAIWLGHAPRDMTYVVMPDNSLLTYPDLESPRDPAYNDNLIQPILRDMKRKLMRDIISQSQAQPTEGELVSTKDN